LFRDFANFVEKHHFRSFSSDFFQCYITLKRCMYLKIWSMISGFISYPLSNEVCFTSICSVYICLFVCLCLTLNLYSWYLNNNSLDIYYIWYTCWTWVLEDLWWFWCTCHKYLWVGGATCNISFRHWFLYLIKKISSKTSSGVSAGLKQIHMCWCYNHVIPKRQHLV
jgi:hypothetical protein